MFENHKCIMFALALMISAVLFIPNTVFAHCDRMNGPVAKDARKALKTGNFKTIAIWVGKEQTDKLRERFHQSLDVYKMGGKAKALAERHFISNAVRLHRKAEGMPFTGLKPAKSLPPDLVRAEKALKTGNLKPVTELLSAEIQKKTQKWFDKAVEAKKNYKDDNVENGREWVDAYVKYIIYVHGLYKKINAGPAHGVGE